MELSPHSIRIERHNRFWSIRIKNELLVVVCNKNGALAIRDILLKVGKAKKKSKANSNHAKSSIFQYEVEIKYKRKQTKRKSIRITSPEQVASLFHNLQDTAKENFLVVSLDAQGVVICMEVVAIGTLNMLIVKPVEVFRSPMLANASSIIIVHNHPSGSPKPTKADTAFTKRLGKFAKEMGLPLRDHVIIGKDNYFSMASKMNLLGF